MRAIEFAITAIAAGDTYTLPIGEPRDPQCFAGVEFYSDASGTPATPTGGTLTGSVRPVVMPNVDVPLTGQDVDLSVQNKPFNWTSPAVSFAVAGLSSVSGGGVTHFRVRATVSPS